MSWFKKKDIWVLDENYAIIGRFSSELEAFDAIGKKKWHDIKEWYEPRGSKKQKGESEMCEKLKAIEDRLKVLENEPRLFVTVDELHLENRLKGVEAKVEAINLTLQKNRINDEPLKQESDIEKSEFNKLLDEIHDKAQKKQPHMDFIDALNAALNGHEITRDAGHSRIFEMVGLRLCDSTDPFRPFLFIKEWVNAKDWIVVEKKKEEPVHDLEWAKQQARLGKYPVLDGRVYILWKDALVEELVCKRYFEVGLRVRYYSGDETNWEVGE